MAVNPLASSSENTELSIALVERAIALADAEAAKYVFAKRFDVEARLAALGVDRLRAAGGEALFSGAPVSIKHNIDVVGHQTLGGCRARDHIESAGTDAKVVRRLRSRGYILLGHTNMTELAFSGLGINPHYGTPRNPAFASEDRIPGGSSAGAAVSVALGIVPAAIGTDTGGSVRIPAAMCGVVGFKPTASEISRQGVLPLSDTLDAVGIVADSASRCSSVFEAIRDVSDVRSSPLRLNLPSLRLGAISDYVLGEMDADVANAYDWALQSLSAAGVAIVPCNFPEIEALPEINRAGTFAAAEAFAQFQDLIRSRAEIMDPEIVRRIEMGATMSAASYIQLMQRRRGLIAAGRRRTGAFDALIMPTIPIIAPRVADLAASTDYHRLNLLVLRNPSIVNFMDGCAISLPCQPAGHPPVGLTLTQSAGRDNELLAVARIVEKALKDARGRV